MDYKEFEEKMKSVRSSYTQADAQRKELILAVESEIPNVELYGIEMEMFDESAEKVKDAIGAYLHYGEGSPAQIWEDIKTLKLNILAAETAREKDTHIVIKREDVFKYLPESEQADLELMLYKISRGRATDMRTPVNHYYVVNKDEPYAENVHGIIIVGEAVKCNEEQSMELSEADKQWNEIWEEIYRFQDTLHDIDEDNFIKQGLCVVYGENGEKLYINEKLSNQLFRYRISH